MPADLSAPAAPGVVGRRNELEELRRALDGTVSGAGVIVLVAGEPGIGKTRLIHEIAEEGRGLGLTVAWGTCWEGEGAPSYWPWIQVIRELALAGDADALRTALGSVARDVAGLVPEIRERLPDVPEPDGRSSDQARFQLFDAVTGYLKRLSRERALIVVLDDLQWADASSLLLLRFLARDLAGTRILVLGAYRDVEVDVGHPLRELLGELTRAGQLLTLGGLGDEDVGALISATAGSDPKPEVAHTIRERTQGNPFYVRELTRLLVSQGRLEQVGVDLERGDPMPDSIREVIARRVARLGARTVEVLSVASVAGHRFGLEALERVTGLGRTHLLECIDEAAAARLVTPSPDAIGQYVFAHTLIRQAQYESLPASRRLELHGLIGEFLESLPSPELRLAELAHHFLQVATAGDSAKARRYLISAAEQAMTRLAYEEGARLFEQALRLHEMRVDTDESARCTILLALGEAQRRAGDFTHSTETFVRAAEIAGRLGNAENLAQAALGAGWGSETEGIGQQGFVDETFVQLLEEALRVLPERDDPLRVRLLGRLAVAQYWSVDAQDRRADLSRRALEMAERLGDPGSIATALASTRYASWGPGNQDERFRVTAQMLELGEAIGDNERILQAHRWRFWDYLERCDVGAADRELAAHERVANESRLTISIGYGRAFRGLRAMMSGRYEEGEKLAREAFAILDRAGHPLALNLFGAQMLQVWWEQGRFQEWHDVIEGFRASQVPSIQIALINARLALGRLEEARASFDRFASAGFETFPQDVTWLPAMALLAQACAQLEDGRAAIRIREMLEPYADLGMPAGPPAVVFFGPVSLYLGMLAACAGDLDGAMDNLERATATAKRMGTPTFVAHARRERAAVLLRRAQPGDREAAVGELREASDIYAEIGLEYFGGKVEEMQRASSASRGEDGQEPALANVFRLDGEFWTIAFEGRMTRLKDSKGLRYLSRLLAEPAREFHVGDLAAITDATGTADRPRISDAGPMLDAEARTAYRNRLEDLRFELDEAEANNDTGRAERARTEMEFLAAELSRATGLGGRDRRASSDLERLRVRVTKALRSALSKVAGSQPGLGNHLDRAVRTGYFCSYDPDPDHPTTWQVAD